MPISRWYVPAHVSWFAHAILKRENGKGARLRSVALKARPARPKLNGRKPLIGGFTLYSST